MKKEKKAEIIGGLNHQSSLCNGTTQKWIPIEEVELNPFKNWDWIEPFFIWLIYMICMAGFIYLLTPLTR